MINLNHSKRNIVLGALLFAAQMTFSTLSFASGGYTWESGVTNNPTAVEPVSGTEFAAYSAFTDWQQNQSVASGAGLSVGVREDAGGIGGVTGVSIWLGNFQNASQTNIHVNAGSYVAITFGTVGADYTVNINSTYVSDYHVDYFETNSTDHTGYIVVYFKLKDFTINYGTNPLTADVKLADITAGTINGTGITTGTVDHDNLIDGSDPGGNTYVSSGLGEATPEIPPQALPAVYSGLGGAMLYLRGRMRRKKRPGSEDKNV